MASVCVCVCLCYKLTKSLTGSTSRDPSKKIKSPNQSVPLIYNKSHRCKISYKKKNNKPLKLLKEKQKRKEKTQKRKEKLHTGLRFSMILWRRKKKEKIQLEAAKAQFEEEKLKATEENERIKSQTKELL